MGLSFWHVSIKVGLDLLTHTCSSCQHLFSPHPSLPRYPLSGSEVLNGETLSSGCPQWHSPQSNHKNTHMHYNTNCEHIRGLSITALQIIRIIRKIFSSRYIFLHHILRWNRVKPCLCVTQWKVSWQRRFWHLYWEPETPASLHCWLFRRWYRVAEKEDRMITDSLNDQKQTLVNNVNPLTFRKVSKSPFLASILSLSMFPNGMSGNIFFGPFTPDIQWENTMKILLLCTRVKLTRPLCTLVASGSNNHF